MKMKKFINIIFNILVLCPWLTIQIDDGKGRLDCAMIRPVNKTTCEDSLCRWNPSQLGIPQAPWCFLDNTRQGYTARMIKTNSHGFKASLSIKPDTKKIAELNNFIDDLNLSVEYLTTKILRFKIMDANKQRYEVPVQEVFKIPNENVDDAKYEAKVMEGDFRLVIKRKETETHLIDTSVGPMLFTNQFLQFATYLPSENLFGLGENYHTQLRHNMNYSTYSIFAHDKPPGDIHEYYYGVHPFYMVIENDGKAHGVLLLNSNAMAYTTLPAPGISLKTTGGIFDFFVFVGDNPEEVVQLYTSIIGHPVMPPFWGLGFQLCRYGYKGTTDLQNIVKRNLDNNVPLDVQYVDIDYMDQFRDFTYDQKAFAQLPQFVNETKDKYHLHWTLIIDPAIQADKKGYKAFEEGYKKNVFIKWPNSVPFKDRQSPTNAPNDKDVIYGKVWPKGPAAFPDFFKNVTQEWWVDMIKDFHGQVKFDALWIDMNEPSNFINHYCPKDGLNIDFPNMRLRNLSEGTICMGSIQGEHDEYQHYDVHSLYGWSETIPTQKGVHEATGKRGFVISRSTYPSSGQFGAHWLGDNFANWEQLHQSIVGMIEFNLFGINFVGADICGFNGNTNAELCKRWFQLGAYYPFSRSHNELGAIDQDPGYWLTVGHPEVTNEMIKAYRVRYQLLHYFYTLFFKAQVSGGTVIRSLAHEFPIINEVMGIDDQFLIGSSILVSPFLKEHQTEVSAYLPPGHWYRFKDDFVEHVDTINKHFTFYDSSSHRPLLLREGFILPIVTDLPEPLNTYELRRKPIELWIMPKENGKASGDLYWDDGESIDTISSKNYNYYEFQLEDCSLTIKPVNHVLTDGNGENLTIKAIKIIFPEEKHLNKVHVNFGSKRYNEFSYTTNHLQIDLDNGLNLFKLTQQAVFSFDSNNICFLSSNS